MENKKTRRFHFSLPELVFLVLIIISAISTGFHSGGFVVDLNRVGFSILSSMQKGVHTVTSAVVNVFTAVQQLGALREENKILTERLKNYEYLQRSNVEIRKENERLKEQLGFSSSIEQKNMVAQVIGRDPNRLYSSITLDKGIKNGVKKNMPVIAIQNGNEGLVGKVVSVGYATSIVMPIYDSRCNVSGRIQNTRDIGLVQGLGSNENNLSLRYIKKRVASDLHYGDVIVTSGENDNYMRDVPIGTISEVTILDYDASLQIELTPIIDFSRLETVIVVDKSEPNTQTKDTEEQNN